MLTLVPVVSRRTSLSVEEVVVAAGKRRHWRQPFVERRLRRHGHVPRAATRDNMN